MIRNVMRHRSLLLCSLLLLPVLLSGCSLAGVDLSFQTKHAPRASGTATLPALPTPGTAPTPAFDLQAGNCPDAAAQDVALITYARSKGYGLDMRLRLSPVTVLCGETGPALESYRARVADAELHAYVIDGSWAGFYPAARVSLAATLVDRLHALYPAAIVKVHVYEGDTLLGSVVLGTDNKRQIDCCAAG